MLMVSRMAKPEEVLIVEDENGNIVSETLKDNDVLVQYKIMRRLSSTSRTSTTRTRDADARQAREPAQRQGVQLERLNTLCWAIGSISGSMAEDQENRFLVTAIRDLLNLCEITRGKDTRLSSRRTSCTSWPVPRFLRLHWKF